MNAYEWAFDPICPKCGRAWSKHIDHDCIPLDPDGPTDAKPGSPEKVAVMERRVENGWRVHHPGDVVLTRSATDDVARGGIPRF